jgi:hypothetical protein
LTAWAHINIWPDELIQLNREILNHPELMERLANHPAGEWEIKLAEIALYCEVIVNGYYLPEELVRLAGILLQKLIDRRKDNRSILIIES